MESVFQRLFVGKRRERRERRRERRKTESLLRVNLQKRKDLSWPVFPAVLPALLK
jgi:hypothetical protein